MKKLILAVLLLAAINVSAGSIEGIISDATTSSPVMGAQVTLFGFIPNIPDSLFQVSFTDSSGFYYFGNLPNGNYFLNCIHPGYFPGNGSITLSDSLNQISVNIQLVPNNSGFGNNVGGQVLSTPPMLPAQIPLPNAHVRLRGNGLNLTAFSDSGGFYNFTNILPGEYTVSASAAFHYPVSDFDTVQVGVNTQINDLNILLVPYDTTGSVILSGYVFSADSLNYPVFPANLNLRGFMSNGDSLFYFISNNPDGSYQFANILPGVYDLTVFAPGFETQNLPGIDLRFDNQTQDVYLNPLGIPPRNNVSGVVTNAVSGVPIPVAMISIDGITNNLRYRSGTDFDGTYAISGINPGLYTIRAAAQGFLTTTPETLNVEDNSQISGKNFALTPFDSGQVATVYGKVFGDSANTVVVHPAQIMAMAYSSNGDSLFYFTQNNPDGSFVLENMIPAVYNFHCSAPGYYPQNIPQVPVNPGQVNLDFHLRKAVQPTTGMISGIVYRDAANTPVAGAMLEFISGNNMHNYRTFSGPDGSYRKQLPQGNYIVLCRVMSPDSLWNYHEFYDNVQSIDQATLVQVVNNDTIIGINFGLPAGSTINLVTVKGQVNDNSGLPLENAVVEVWPKNIATFAYDSTFFRAFTDAQGNYEITMLFNYPVPVFRGIISAAKSGFKTEFYQEKTAPYLADILFATTDTVFNSINFTLDPAAAGNSVSGNISGINGMPLSNVFVIASNTVSGQIVFAFSDQQGNYFLPNLDNEQHFLLFNKENYVPEFYDDALLWEDATPVYASGSITGIDAQLTPVMPDSGAGIIAGMVRDNSGEPLSGVMIMARNPNNAVVGFTFSDANGGYEIAGLADGEYDVMASKVKYQSESISVYYSIALGSVMMVDFTLDESITKIDINESGTQLPQNLELVGNFPNPFNPRTKIRFNTPVGQHLRLVVYNLLGQQVRLLVDHFISQGSYEVEWDGLDEAGHPVSSGVYFYSLEAGPAKIVRKMIFSK